MLVKIYELRDPRDESKSPRYVGMTSKSLEKRLFAHLQSYYLEAKTYKNNWIKTLLLENIKPTIHLIEEVEDWKYACEVEKYWIKEFRAQEYRLTNLTDGGDGVIGYIMSEEAKLKLSKTLTGKVNSEKVRKLASLRWIGNNHGKNNCKKVIQYDLNMNKIKEYDSITIAANELSLKRYNISAVCLKHRKTCGGFIWRHKKDE